EAAHIAWRKDRAYMPDLANSCYTYRDESAELFRHREVRCGFDAELTRPRPGQKAAFWRRKRVSIREGSAGDGRSAYVCESAMEDNIHDILVGFEIAGDGTISGAHSRGLRLPYHGICEDAQQRTPGLNGLSVTTDYVRQFAEYVGGSSGCTHLFDLSIDCLRLFRFSELDLFVGNGLGRALHCGVDGVPRKARAFDARREFPHAGEDLQPPQMIRFSFGIKLAFHHPVEFIKEYFDFFLRLALHRRGHHRSRSFRDRATRALKADVFDDITVQLQVERQLIAAERIVPDLRDRRMFERLEIARLFIVIENDLLIGFVQISHTATQLSAISGQQSASG